MKSYCKYSKATSAGIWKRILEIYFLHKNNRVRPPKLPVQKKRNVLQQTKRLQEAMLNFFVKKE